MLDVNCGAGLSLPYLVEAVGQRGEAVGVDASEAMLARARHRIETNRWCRVRLITADAGTVAAQVPGTFDAAVFAYSLAVIDDWRASWHQVLDRVRPGGWVAMVDTAYPTEEPGIWRSDGGRAGEVPVRGGDRFLRRRSDQTEADDAEPVRAAL